MADLPPASRDARGTVDGMGVSPLLERLTERDLALLADAGGASPDELRSKSERLDELVGSSEVFDRLLAPWSDEALLLASPFLLFSVFLARTATELSEAAFVREWVGPNRRLPVFDVAGLRAFAADPEFRVFLADVLASYTHVASGTMWVRSARGWSRRRFSELDPVRMAELADAVPSRERPAVLRRLGDLALFLTGVFPDQTDGRLFPPIHRERLARSVRSLPVHGEHETPDMLPLLERLGEGSYRAALRQTSPAWRDGHVLHQVAERFGHARRVLNALTERFLFPRREDWFSAG
jgi:hypothetical protein